MIRPIRISLLMKISLLILSNLSMTISTAEDDPTNIEYIPIEPVIVTNYLKKSQKKPGFIQIKAHVTVHSKVSADLITKHMPLVRDFIIEYLSFTDESLIKDASQRNQLRASLTTGIQQMLTEQVGEPLIEELVFTHYMWD